MDPEFETAVYAAGALFEVKRGPKPVDESSPEDKPHSEIGMLNKQVDWLRKKLGK